MNLLYIVQSSDSVSRKMGDETIIMLSPESHLLTLNETATLIWEAADGVTPLDTIVTDKVCEVYAVDYETAYADALMIVEALAQKRVLNISGSPFLNDNR